MVDELNALRERAVAAEAEAARRTDEIVAIGEALGRPGATAVECAAMAAVATRGYETMRRALAHLASGCEFVQCLVARPGEMTAECRVEAPCVACLAAATARHLRDQNARLRPGAIIHALRTGRFVDHGCSRDPSRWDITSDVPMPACVACGAIENGPCVAGVDPAELARATAAATKDGVVDPYALTVELFPPTKADAGDAEIERLTHYADFLLRNP